MAAPDTFRWTEAYSVNIGILDEQHRALIDTVAQLREALHCREGNSVLGSVLHDLVDYAGVHFLTEEGLMEQHEFPGLALHRAQHEEFRERVAEFLQAYRAGRQCVAVSLHLYVETWLREHLRKTDMLYSAYLNARGVR